MPLPAASVGEFVTDRCLLVSTDFARWSDMLLGPRASRTSALASADDSPSILTQVWVRDAHKQVWAKAFILLKDRCLYFSYKFPALAKFLRQNRRLDPPSPLASMNSHKVSDDDGGRALRKFCKR
ncbi:hypothetical protein FOCC_FOCC011899 [Frankliniella occidentalis]|nr:hypothetical protein FOCC_FOCC011899 [Frankliniella occidentalis]